jgi:hypothetical protein
VGPKVILVSKFSLFIGHRGPLSKAKIKFGVVEGAKNTALKRQLKIEVARPTNTPPLPVGFLGVFKGSGPRNPVNRPEKQVPR